MAPPRSDLPPSPPPSPPPPTPDRPICPNQSIWSSLDHTALKRLISEQIPRFAQRPYLQGDSSSIRAALEEDLDFDGDYCWALSLEPAFVRALCHEGFLPICSELGGGTGLFALLPKLHAQRCVLHFSSLHVPRKVRRRAVRHGYTLTAGDHAASAHAVQLRNKRCQRARRRRASSPVQLHFASACVRRV